MHWSQASIDFNGAASKLDAHWINTEIMSRPMEEWPGLLRADWRVMSKDSISFWLTAILCYNKLLKLFERRPIVDFASVVERQNAAMYLFGQFSSYISHNYTPHSSFQVLPNSHIPSVKFVCSFIHSYSRLEHCLQKERRPEFTYK